MYKMLVYGNDYSISFGVFYKIDSDDPDDTIPKSKTFQLKHKKTFKLAKLSMMSLKTEMY